MANIWLDQTNFYKTFRSWLWPLDHWHALSSKSPIFRVAYLEELKPQIQMTNRNACHISLNLNLNWIELNQMIPVCFVRVCTIHVFLILSLCLSSSSSSSFSSSLCVRSVNEALLSDFGIYHFQRTLHLLHSSFAHERELYLFVHVIYQSTHIRTRILWYICVCWMEHAYENPQSESPVDKFRAIVSFVVLQLYGIVGALWLQFNSHTVWIHTRNNSVLIFHSIPFSWIDPI